MAIEQHLLEKSADIRAIAARHGAHNVRIFGSAARGEAGPQSDFDFLVEVGAETSSWFPAGLVVDLEDLLGRRIEVVTERGLNPEIRERVLSEAVSL